MTFVVLMALREVRASWRRLLFFFVCVAIVVRAIVMLRSIIQTVRSSLTRESRALTAAGRAIATNRPRTPGGRIQLWLSRAHRLRRPPKYGPVVVREPRQLQDPAQDGRIRGCCARSRAAEGLRITLREHFLVSFDRGSNRRRSPASGELF